jgi:hypothetical protein
VALGDEMRQQLEKAAEASGASVAEEIRRRVARTFEEDAKAATIDEATRNLHGKIADLAEEVELETAGAWHAHPGSFAVFRRGVLWLLAQLKPEGAPTLFERVPPLPSPRPHQSDTRSDPDEIGIMLASRVMEASSPEHRRRWRAAMEKDIQEIRAIHERRARGESNGK